MSRAAQQSTPSRRTRRPRLIPVTVGLGVMLAVAGCGAGQITQTDTQVAAVNGSSGSAGPMLIRDAQLAFPATDRKYLAGSDAPLVLTIVNSGDNADQLTSVTSPNAASAEISGQTDIPARFAVAGGVDTDDELRQATTSAQPGTSGSATPSSTGQSSAAPTSTGGAPADEGKKGTVKITLKGLNRDIQPGQKIEVHFLFRNSGEVVLALPIAAPTNPRTVQQQSEGHAG